MEKQIKRKFSWIWFVRTLLVGIILAWVLSAVATYILALWDIHSSLKGLQEVLSVLSWFLIIAAVIFSLDKSVLLFAPPAIFCSAVVRAIQVLNLGDHEVTGRFCIISLGLLALIAGVQTGFARGIPVEEGGDDVKAGVFYFVRH